MTVDSLMFCGIGLLAGCLLMLMFIPLVHERAVRITTRNIADATPLAAHEIRADKDRLRAQFAMTVRQLEVNIGEMRTKAASHLSKFSRQNRELEEAKTKVASQLSEISRQNRELDEMRTASNEMRTKAASQFSEIIGQNRELEETRTKVASQLSEISRQNRELDGMRTESNEMRTKAASQLSEISRQNREINEMMTEINEMRERAASQRSEISRQNREINLLYGELDKKTALIFALQRREQVRKGIVRKIVKLLPYTLIRSDRRRQRRLFGAPQGPSMAHN